MRVGYSVMRRLVTATPKKWTGQVRREWQVLPQGSSVIVTNPSKIMFFLEKGTRAHGATNGKFLYIPLHPAAAMWRPGLKRGRDFILTKRVRGIKARRIAERERPVAAAETLAALTSYVNKTIAKS